MRDHTHGPAETGNDTHITSLVVHVLPEAIAPVSDVLNGMPGVDVHTADESGKMVVIVETTTLSLVTDLIDQINAMAGVVGATLVFHQIEESASLDLPVDAGTAETGHDHHKEPAA